MNYFAEYCIILAIWAVLSVLLMIGFELTRFQMNVIYWTGMAYIGFHFYMHHRSRRLAREAE